MNGTTRRPWLRVTEKTWRGHLSRDSVDALRAAKRCAIDLETATEAPEPGQWVRAGGALYLVTYTRGRDVHMTPEAHVDRDELSDWMRRTRGEVLPLP